MVRSYLVGLRGGAVFLSSADATLLRRWLEDEVPLWAILEGLDKAAAKRREKRMRTPLSLQHAKPFLKGALQRRASSGLDALQRELAEHALPEVRALKLPDEELDAVRRIAAFHEERWEKADQESWRIRADAALEDLRELVGEERYKALREETARDLHRQEVAALCASRVWDTQG